MNWVRAAISVFILALLALVVLGWSWTGRHQPPAQATASHVVLAISGVMGVYALVAIWRPNPPRSGSGRT